MCVSSCDDNDDDSDSNSDSDNVCRLLDFVIVE